MLKLGSHRRSLSAASKELPPLRTDPMPPAVTVVVPVFNALRFLRQTVPAILAAGHQSGGVEFVYVDNGSTDGSLEFLEGFASDGIRVYRRPGVTIAALRNFGARNGSGTYLSFLDADCCVPREYFVDAVDLLRSSGASATGCEVCIPESPKWIEAAWHDLHYVGRERDVRYLNSGNFFVARTAFDQVGGFRENMVTGEDAEIGDRLTAAGHRIRACPRVAAIHFGNPKSILDFYRRNVWHGLGMFGTVSARRIDRPTAMMVLHLLASIAGVFILVATPLALIARVLVAIALQIGVPATTVVYRAQRTRWTRRVGQGLFLYWLYYWARLYALALVASGRSDRYRK